MEIILDITKPAISWMKDVPNDLSVLIGYITSPFPNRRFNFKRFYNKPGQRYYQSPISVNSLFDMNGCMAGYLINYKGYEIQVNESLHEICIIK